MEDPGVDGRIRLKLIFETLFMGGMDWIDLTVGRDCFECGDDPSGFIKCGEFLELLITC